MEGHSKPNESGVVLLAADPDIAADLIEMDYDCQLWTPELQASVVRYATVVVIVTAADDDSLAYASGVLSWAQHRASGGVFKVVVPGLGVEVRDLRSWVEAGNGLAKLIEAARANAVQGKVRGVKPKNKARRWRDDAGEPADSVEPTEAPSALVHRSPYSVVGGRLCRTVTNREGSFQSPLCNFIAKIVEEVFHDDGVERSMQFPVEGSLATGGTLPSIEVSSEEFPRGDWPLSRWGRRAIVYAGQGNKDHLRCAIQVLSDQAVSRVFYAHAGWRKIDDRWLYLHGGGSIGPLGLQDLAVETPDALQLLCLTVRSVLPSCSFSGHLAGRTGAGKTELAAWAQQFFGAELDSEHLPASWSSTGNSLEMQAFACKDALMVVDDLRPHGSQIDVSRSHKDADRVFRSQGNRSGGRLSDRTGPSSRPSRHGGRSSPRAKTSRAGIRFEPDSW